MAGYPSTDAYYAAHNPLNYVWHSTIPALFINAENDPLCVLENFTEQRPRMLGGMSCSTAVVVTKTGSHCPFYE
ncbi:hypothetical protein B484DRAFT_410105, partial [Ochromonadaceae sp. CCMP2298]